MTVDSDGGRLVLDSGSSSLAGFVTAMRIQHQAHLQRERCLLYVAATRARDALWVGWSGKKSRFLGD